MEQESHLQICVTNRGGQGWGVTFQSPASQGAPSRFADLGRHQAEHAHFVDGETPQGSLSGLWQMTELVPTPVICSPWSFPGPLSDATLTPVLGVSLSSRFGKSEPGAPGSCVWRAGACWEDSGRPGPRVAPRARAAPPPLPSPGRAVSPH